MLSKNVVVDLEFFRFYFYFVIKIAIFCHFCQILVHFKGAFVALNRTTLRRVLSLLSSSM